MIEAARNRHGDGDEVLVPPVARPCQHDDAPAGDIEALRETGQHPDGMRIVSIIEQHLERMLVEYVHASGCLVERRVEGTQALTDGVELDAERKRHGGGEHRILYVVRRAAFERGRDQVGPKQRNMAAAII